jgi:hypothetical protein
MKNLLIFWLIFSTVVKAQNSYFTIGSSEDKVLQVQGQPSSIMRTGIYSTFMYGSSSVSFTNNLVDGYSNRGNLKIKVVSSVKNNNSTKKKTAYKSAKTSKKVNTEVKWIYFTFMTTSYSGPDVDFFSGKLIPHEFEYSKIYSISGYTYEMQKNLEFCLTKNYKESNGESVSLIPHVFDDRDLALRMWNAEKGRMSRISSCYYLMQYGVTEH